MHQNNKTILVAGATGNQGGAAVRQLLKSGWQVRALTRSPDKPAAQALASQGVEVIAGDFDDRSSLDKALQDIYGVFSVQNFLQQGTEKEIEQGKALADAASLAGVKHFVYSSVGGAERNTGIAHFESKWAIEQHIRSLGLPATILRPAFFMENLLFPGLIRFVMWSALDGALGKDQALQLIAVDDIGEFVAIAFNNPDKYIGIAIEIAGDELTIPQAAKIYNQVTGKPPLKVPLPTQVFKLMNAEFAGMFQWFRDKGYKADIHSLRQLYPELKTLEQWIKEREAESKKSQ